LFFDGELPATALFSKTFTDNPLTPQVTSIFVELSSYIRSEFHTRGLMIVGDAHVEDVLFLKIRHTRLTHN
jgi:hypothetical protein